MLDQSFIDTYPAHDLCSFQVDWPCPQQTHFASHCRQEVVLVSSLVVVWSLQHELEQQDLAGDGTVRGAMTRNLKCTSYSKPAHLFNQAI
jgi:hypothetical protein